MTHRPRIVHIYKDIWPPVEGGIERIIHLMARGALTEFDVRVVVAATGRLGTRRIIPTPEGDLHITEVPCFGRALSAPLAPGFVGALRRSGANLFHFHVPHPTGEVAYLASRLRTPSVTTYHSDVVRQRAAMRLYGPVFLRFLRRQRVIMPTSNRYLATSPHLQVHRDRCRVVPLGYPLEDYEPDDAVRRHAAQLRGEHGEFILFLGCLRAYKGLAYLLQALTHLPRARAVIAGDGATRAELEQQAEQLGLAGRVLFTGRVSHPEALALLHGASVFCLPAHQRSEAFGLCQVEAMACGLPVVSTDLPTGVPEVNGHGESGLIVPPADPVALAEALNRLLENPGLRAELGEGGRQRAREHFHWHRMCDQVNRVYHEVLREHTG